MIPFGCSGPDDGTAIWYRPLRPTQLLQRVPFIPDLRHMTDLIAFEIHDIDVISGDLLSRWRNGATLTGLRTVYY